MREGSVLTRRDKEGRNGRKTGARDERRRMQHVALDDDNNPGCGLRERDWLLRAYDPERPTRLSVYFGYPNPTTSTYKPTSSICIYSFLYHLHPLIRATRRSFMASINRTSHSRNYCCCPGPQGSHSENSGSTTCFSCDTTYRYAALDLSQDVRYSLARKMARQILSMAC